MKKLPKKDSLEDEKLPSNKNFGLTFSTICISISSWVWLTGKSGSYIGVLFVTGIVFVFFTFLQPQLLSRLNFLWYKFGVQLSKVMNPIIMTIVYFILFAPIKFLYFFSKKNKSRYSDESTWIKRDKDIGSMRNQF